jgi:hypothetical protein
MSYSNNDHRHKFFRVARLQCVFTSRTIRREQNFGAQTLSLSPPRVLAQSGRILAALKVFRRAATGSRWQAWECDKEASERNARGAAPRKIDMTISLASPDLVKAAIEGG